MNWGVNVPSQYKFTSYSNFAFNEVIGIALNGVPIYPGRNKDLYDYLQPKAYPADTNALQASNVDICLGEIDGSLYHYRGYSPCILGSILNDLAMLCSANQGCSNGYHKYLEYYDSSLDRALIPIGVARDGRRIIGPYDSNGNYWQPCDVDFCNGLYINGEYVYAATVFFPYITSCYGPSNNGMLIPSCSSNPRVCF